MNYELRPYQVNAVRDVWNAFDNGEKTALVVLPTGCHAFGEKVMMVDGTTKNAEDVVVGDQLMGEDGLPRNVLFLHKGKSSLFRIVPTKGEPFVVNGEHKLTLQRTPVCSNPKYPSQVYNDEYVDISVNDYFKLSKNQKHLLKLVHSKGVDFVDECNNLPIDPYFLGILIGDGYLCKSHLDITTMDKPVIDEIYRKCDEYAMNVRLVPAGKANTYVFSSKTKELEKGTHLLIRQLKELGLLEKNSGEKFIPNLYKKASKENRLALLAGLLDSDGHLTTNCFDYISKSKQLAEDIAFVGRSLGLRVTLSKCTKKIKKLDFEGTYYRLFISGDTASIPCRVKKASDRGQKKNCLRSGFSIEYVGIGNYAGFTIDGDNRYLLPDFTITHNCGKTTVMAAIAEEQVKRGKRVLLLAHRNSLLVQGQNSIENATGIHVGFEGGKSHPCKDDRIVVSSVQTLSRTDRIGKFNPKAFGLIMVDEAHHIPAKTYKTIMEYFGEAKVLGVTATPKRGDNTDVSTLFGTVVSEYTLSAAIKDGWLSPIKVQQCPITIDVSGVNLQSGDYAVGEIGEALLPYLDAVADAILDKARGRKTIIFVPLVSTAVGMVEILKRKGARADYVAGERKDSPEIMNAYHNGEIDILINSLLLTEGYDEPSISCVVNLRLTKSEALLTQIIGRGTRLSPGKEDLLVLDFLWKDKEKRKRLNTQALIAAGDDSIPAEELASVLAACADDTNGKATDVFEAVEEAKARAKKQRESALAKALADAQFKEERARKLAEERKEYAKLAENAKKWGESNGYLQQYNAKIDVIYAADSFLGMKWIDAIFVKDSAMEALGIASFLTSDRPSEQEEPSVSQLNMLSTFGIDADKVVNMGHASFLLRHLFERRKEEYCSYKQAKTLLRYGIKDVENMDESLAKAAMNILSKNKWKPNDAFWALFKE